MWQRKSLQELARLQRLRVLVCPFVPLYLLFFLCGIVSFTLRADVSAGGEVRRFLSTRLAPLSAWRDDGGVSLGGSGSALSWLESAWVPALTGDAGALGVLVGGLRLSQWRAAGSGAAACPPLGLPAYAAALLPAGGAAAPCSPAAPALSSAPFGPAALPGAALAAPGPWDSAFSPLAPPLQASLDAAFPAASVSQARAQYLLPASFSLALRGVGAAGDAAALGGAGWVDGATLALECAGVGIIPALGRWARWGVLLEAQGGGSFSGAVATCVAPLQGGEAPGGAAAGLALGFADAGFVAGTVLLLFSALKTLATLLLPALVTPHGRKRCARVALGQEGGDAFWRGMGGLFDLACAAACLASVATASLASGSIGKLNAFALAASSGTPSESPLDPTLTPPGLLRLHAHVEAACSAQQGWLGASAAACLFLSARALRLLLLTPRLANLKSAASSCLSDAAHFGALFFTAVLAFAVFAHAAFGATAVDFSTLPAALLALLKMMVFDYSYGPISAGGAALASAFFSLFMLLVTHALLWSWLGIALEAYSLARHSEKDRAALAPTLAEDAINGLGGTYAWACAAWAFALQGRRSSSSSGGSAAPSVGGGAPPSAAGLAATARPWERRKAMLQALDKFLAALEDAEALESKGGAGTAPAPSKHATAVPGEGAGGASALAVGATSSSSSSSAVSHGNVSSTCPLVKRGFITSFQLARHLGRDTSPLSAKNAGDAVFSGADCSIHYGEALLGLVAGAVGNSPSSIEMGEEDSIHHGEADEGEATAVAGDGGALDDAAPQATRIVAVRGMLIRTSA